MLPEPIVTSKVKIVTWSPANFKIDFIGEPPETKYKMDPLFHPQEINDCK